MGVAPMGFVGHTGADPGVVCLMFFNTKTRRGFTFILNRSIIYEYEEALNDLMEVVEILTAEISIKKAEHDGESQN